MHPIPRGHLTERSGSNLQLWEGAIPRTSGAGVTRYLTRNLGRRLAFTSAPPGDQRFFTQVQRAGKDVHSPRLVGGHLPDVGCGSTQVESQLTFEQELLEYICSGPLQKSCRISPANVRKEFNRWVELGDVLISNLSFPPKQELSSAQRMRIYQYYLPIFFWAEDQLKEHREKGLGKRPLVLGIQAPQGCGKTTIVEELEKLFTYTGLRPAAVSIDDFYLTYEAQQALARANPSNSLLQYRGNAGSHDLDLGKATLDALVGATSPDTAVAVPRYDKSQNAGRGDRAPKEAWPQVQGPVDVVLFEGWMLGFAPVHEDAAAAVSPDLLPVNDFLKAYREAWDKFVDCWLVVKVADPAYVYKWRLQAEHAMQATGKPGMTDEQVADFVDRYMPAYLAYLEGLYKHGPTTAQPGHVLMLEIGEDRSLLPQQPLPPAPVL